MCALLRNLDNVNVVNQERILVKDMLSGLVEDKDILKGGGILEVGVVRVLKELRVNDSANSAVWCFAVEDALNQMKLTVSGAEHRAGEANLLKLDGNFIATQFYSI